MTIATVAVGVGCVTWLGIVAWSFERSVVDAHASATRADLVVSSPHIASGVNAAPIDGDLSRTFASVAGVASVAGNRVVDWRYGDGPVAIDAYDPGYFEVAQRVSHLIGPAAPDAWHRVAAGEAALVSANFVYNVGLRTGDRLELETPGGSLVLPIAGVVSHLWSPRGSIVLSRALYERFWRDASVTRIFVHLQPGAKVDAVRSALAASAGARWDLHVFSGAALVDYFAAQARRAFAGVDLLAALVLAIVLVAVADSLAAGVAEHTWEMGALKAIGASPRVVRNVVVLEAIGLVTIGLGLAGIAGLVLAWLWVDATFTHLLGWVLDWHVPIGRLAAVAGATAAVSVVAAWWPAQRARALMPATALRAD